eukprot:scaffold14682_cov68-Skeletonema_dohrnii-CCMP3373.AAC.2
MIGRALMMLNTAAAAAVLSVYFARVVVLCVLCVHRRNGGVSLFFRSAILTQIFHTKFRYVGLGTALVLMIFWESGAVTVR